VERRSEAPECASYCDSLLRRGGDRGEDVRKRKRAGVAEGSRFDADKGFRARDWSNSRANSALQADKGGLASEEQERRKVERTDRVIGVTYTYSLHVNVSGCKPAVCTLRADRGAVPPGFGQLTGLTSSAARNTSANVCARVRLRVRVRVCVCVCARARARHADIYPTAARE